MHLDRGVGVVQRRFEQLRQLRKQLVATRFILFELKLTAKIPRERSVIPGPGVNALESPRGLENDLRVVALHSDELLINLLRLFRLGLGYIPELGQLEEQLRLDEVVADRGKAAFEQLGTLTMTCQLRGEPRKIGARNAISDVLANGPGIGIEGELVVSELGLAKLANPDEMRCPGARIGEILELHLQDLGELAPGAL